MKTTIKTIKNIRILKGTEITVPNSKECTIKKDIFIPCESVLTSSGNEYHIATKTGEKIEVLNQDEFNQIQKVAISQGSISMTK